MAFRRKLSTFPAGSPPPPSKAVQCKQFYSRLSGNEDSELTRAFFLGVSWRVSEFHSQTDEETHRYRLESIESKTPAHSLCDRGKESRLQQGPSGPCFTVSIWLAPTTNSASSSDCGKLASVRVDLRDDLSGKCLTADNLSEGRDVDITTSAG